MKIVISFNENEKNAIENTVEAYKDIIPDAEGCVEIEEAHKGFSVKNFLTKSGGYQMTMSIPDWVITEYTGLAVKYHSKVTQVCIIFKQLELLCNDWIKEIHNDIKVIKEKHLK